MKKLILTPDNPNGIVEDLTAEEVSELETIKANNDAEETAQAEAKEVNDNLKASAKAKLIAGEPITEAEADTLIL